MEKIFVTIRVRPLNKVELSKGSPWKLESNSITLCNNTGVPIAGQSYLFDKVFDSETPTLEIYETHTKDIIASAVKGFNGTVFAYGQTSSGKTYTMRGSQREPGIIPLAVQEIFKNIEEAEDREFLLRVSYMEIYNEEINDLLAPENRKLQVHENVERGIFVAGLREEIVVNPEQVLELMKAGETYRHVGETNMNTYSSRSHSIFRMVIESRDRSHDGPAGSASAQSCDAVRVSVLNLVDLAGSERVAKTGAEGARLKEGTHINRSLMTLGTVINKLSEGVEKQGGHVPYRDSKLTRILQPALGGNAKTAVICNITPSQIHVDETKGTLFFASRANRVTNCAQVNEVMTDAALLKRQKKEIEELRGKLQENHSEHWDAEILNLRNALLKTELERERMALELQQEKAAQAERERQLKEQQQKIENLSTMVINSAVDDRNVDKRSKKNNRRETWCPRIPVIEGRKEPLESKIPFPKDPPRMSMFSTRRGKLPPLPPPFESLVEGEDTVVPFQELNENAFDEDFQSFPPDGSNLDSIFQEPPPVLFVERKRRSCEESVDDDLRQELVDLREQYDDLQLQHECKMRDKMLEMKELKEELAFAQSAANKTRKLDNMNKKAEDIRGKSLDGLESDAIVQQLRAQIQNLELEKFYVQKELDTLKEQAAADASSAHSNLMKVQEGLQEAREDASKANVDLSLALERIRHLQHDQQLGIEQQSALTAHFNELVIEVETTKSSSEAFYEAAVDSTNALRATLMNLQESLIDVKSFRLAAKDEQFGSLQSDVQALLKEHDSLFSVLLAVQNERDAFCEVSKAAQGDLKSLEEEIRGKNDELAATGSDLVAANKQIVDAGNKIFELQTLLTQHERQHDVLEQNIKDLESEAVGAISKAQKEKLEGRIADLERELELVSQEKADLICKGEAVHATIQVLEGEKDALIETSRQAQADIDRLQGRKRQELKEAQDKLENALSESYLAKEQLISMRSLLSEKTEEQQDLQFKLVNLQIQATNSTKTLNENIQALETDLAQRSMMFESCKREYEELVAGYEAIKREKCELSEVRDSSEYEISRLCRDLDIQGQALAEAENKLESGRVQSSKDESQLSELRLALSEQTAVIEGLRRTVANLSAEKCAMETCLAGHSPETINSVLMEKSLQLSTAECSLQSNMVELEKIKYEFALLQELKSTLELELVEARNYSVAVEETLSEAVSTIELTNQEKENLKTGLEDALKESELKSGKLAGLENECASLDLLLPRILSIPVSNLMNSIHSTRTQDQQALKEQNFHAERELKEFGVEVQRQLQEIEVQRQLQEIQVAERDIEAAKSENLRSAEIISDLRESCSQKSDEILLLRNQFEDLRVKSSSLENDLEKKGLELELAKKHEDALTLEIGGAQQLIADLELRLLEKNEKIMVLSEELSNLESEFSGMREDINKKVAEMEHLVQLTSSERAILEDKAESAVVDFHKVKEERDELLLTILDLKAESKQLKQLLSDEESRLEDAKLKLSSANGSIQEFQDLLAMKNAELEQLEHDKNGLVEKMSATEHSLREELDRRIQDCQTCLLQKTAELEEAELEKESIIERMTNVERSLKDEIERKVEEFHALSVQKATEFEQVEQEKKSLVESMTIAGKSLREELEREIHDLQESVSNLEAVNLKAHEKLLQVESHLNESIEEKERVIKEKDVLLDSSVQLQDRISCLERECEQYQVELKQMESRIASVTAEIDDAGKQLDDVHSLLTENQNERLILQRSLEELENQKAGLENHLSIKEAELKSTVTALADVKTHFEAFQQQQYTESSQLKADILGLRKELKAAKAAPGALEKERDGLRKDLEKLKSKLGDIEAKLKSTLIEKSKAETEKLNIEREVKQLRQSTALLNKRESIVDKRRESVACGLNKTKQQLSSVEHALQMKSNELEKTAFDLQLLQENYAKLEADMVETENASVILKNRLAEAEIAISELRDEKGATSSILSKISEKLEDELEQKKTIVAQFDALRSEHKSTTEKLLAFQVASVKLEADIKSISLERDNFSLELIDAHTGFVEEKAVWAFQLGQSDAKVLELQQEISNSAEKLEKVQRAQEELVATRNTLQEQLDETEHSANTTRVALQEQLSKLQQSLQCSEQESSQLRQQVELLSSNVQEHVELQSKLQEEMFVVKEQYEALQVEFKKLKDLLVVSETDIQRERQSTVDLAEEIKQLNRMLQEAELKYTVLNEKNSDFEAMVRKESDKKMQLLEERRTLADRCVVYEEQISQLEVSCGEGRETESRLLQEIEKLREELHTNMEVAAEKSEVGHRASEQEAAWIDERETARKQVAKLQSELKLSNGEIESLQTELDDVGMKVKSLYIEVDDMQAALDQSRTEKSMLKQQLVDMLDRLSGLEDKNEQLEKDKIHLLQIKKSYLTAKTKLQFALFATRGRLEISQSLLEQIEEKIEETVGQKIAAMAENDRLRVKLQNLRSRCQRYEEALKEAKSKKMSPKEEQERENQIAEIMQQNSTLQLRLQKTEEIAKARREEMAKLHEVVLRKEESNSKLAAALEQAQDQVLKVQRDSHGARNEPQIARRFEGSAMSSGNFTTPMASRHSQDDADDADTLYANSLASKSKVEQWKLQNESVLRMCKQPWRMQGSAGGSEDDTGDHPPPSATLDSHRENMTAPIPTWKRGRTAEATSNTEFLQPSNSAFGNDKLRGALLPVNGDNKLQAMMIKRRLQDLGAQEKLPVCQGGVQEPDTGKPSATNTQVPRNFRFNQRHDKENL